jgi:hypothetical protein
LGSGTGSPTISFLFSRELKLFSELQVEYRIIKRFKWFSNVLLRLKPRFRLFNEVSIDVENKIVFASQVYLHPRACGGGSVLYVWSLQKKM